jgi:hypothetical protein
MARIGSVPAAPFVGDQFASLYLGTERVPTVPGKPVIISPFPVLEELPAGQGFYFDNPANDGGSEITEHRVFIDGQEVAPEELAAFGGSGSFEVFLANPAPGSSAQVSAVNAVGEGPRSAPFTLPAE